MLEGREQDMKELRDTLVEREEELAAVTDRVAELQAAQGETHDQLEETLRNIERDNADKEADLVAANREVEEVSSSNSIPLTSAWTTRLRAGRRNRRASPSRAGSQYRLAECGRGFRERQGSL